MADLTATIAGIVSPNPFWLASAPPTNTYGQVARAFELVRDPQRPWPKPPGEQAPGAATH